MGRASLYFTYKVRHFKDSVGPQIQDAILYMYQTFRGGGNHTMPNTKSLLTRTEVLGKLARGNASGFRNGMIHREP